MRLLSLFRWPFATAPSAVALSIRLTPLTALAAFVLGIVMAAAGLAYSAEGRINVIYVWLLWAGLPLLGSLLAVIPALTGRRRPWLFRWRQQHAQWHPSLAERLSMALLLQVWWLIAALGLLCGFGFLLLFSDLAFGWRSTLLQGPEPLYHLARGLALPWRELWPAALPSMELVEATRFYRIQPAPVDPQLAGGWWSFLLASMLVYNLLPRSLLAGILILRLQLLKRKVPVVSGSTAVVDRGAEPVLQARSLQDWQQVPVITWELADAGVETAALRLGNNDWQQDEQQFREWLKSPQEHLVWQVNAERSPVAELADLITMARSYGIRHQALRVVSGPQTDPQRHIASWQMFAARQGLIWLEQVS